jgi:adenylate cyclase
MRGLAHRLRRFGPGRVVGLLLLLDFLFLRLWDPQPVEALRNAVFDVYQKVLPRTSPAERVAIVDVDETSLKELGQWPWPRTVLAELVGEIARKGGAVIGFDMLFPEADRTSPPVAADTFQGIDEATRETLRRLPSNDEVLAGAIGRAKVVVGQSGYRNIAVDDRQGPALQTGLATLGADPGPFLVAFPHLLRNLPVIEAAAQGRGLFSFKPEQDGVVRRVPLVAQAQGVVVPTLVLEMIRLHRDAGAILVATDAAGIRSVGLEGLDIPTDGRGRAWIHYARADLGRYLPAHRVLAGAVPRERLDGKLVLIGTSAVGLLDLKTTPIDPAMPGIELHAQVLESILSGTLLRRPPWMTALELLAAALLSLLLIVQPPSVRAGALFVLGGTVAATTLGLAWFSFAAFGYLFDCTFPLATSFAIYLTLISTNYIRASAERQMIRTAFSQYISPALVEQLAASPDKLVLGGERRVMTVMFSDVRGFTAVSESYREDPQGLTALLNRLLTPLTNCVIGHKGTIDKYIGDGIMAFWNAPIDDPSHEINACEAALDMLASLDALNRQRAAEGALGGVATAPLRIGIGLNTGDCFVGNFGSDLQFNYSVLGDAVNVSSRLESQSKTYGVPIVVGERTARAVAGRFAILELDRLRVLGKTEPERIFTILGRADTAADEGFRQLSALNAAMLEAYRGRNWTGALEAILACRDFGRPYGLDDYYALFVTRIRAMIETPPAEDWGGVTVLETK